MVKADKAKSATSPAAAKAATAGSYLAKSKKAKSTPTKFQHKSQKLYSKATIVFVSIMHPDNFELG